MSRLDFLDLALPRRDITWSCCIRTIMAQSVFSMSGDSNNYIQMYAFPKIALVYVAERVSTWKHLK